MRIACHGCSLQFRQFQIFKVVPMNDEFSQREAIEQPPESAGLVPLTSGQQRRQLLRSMAATGAVVGVGLPMSAQATVRPHCRKAGDNNNYHPTASAVGSMIGSSTGGLPPIAGHNSAHYRYSGGWTSTSWTNGRPTPRALTYDRCANLNPPSGTNKRTFAQVFELLAPSFEQARNCCDILHSYSGSDEAHWLTAIFNANKRAPFAYRPSQVVDLYKGINPIPGGAADPNLRSKALLLFKDYLSGMS